MLICSSHEENRTVPNSSQERFGRCREESFEAIAGEMYGERSKLQTLFNFKSPVKSLKLENPIANDKSIGGSKTLELIRCGIFGGAFFWNGELELVAIMFIEERSCGLKPVDQLS
ncbi:hypothetical protein MJO28_007747 [Puccinia striiformis f. sp. tritici]|uniref:Uncharacterized protein n=1 Tax=Puccinia striiformis f. sp. tritici TaxID=168172 RepID=A0ACC0EGJ5_9BASI|nr:hypothetical protein MJO28_007747 [Puccinia striiformis f. sp. tritici]